MTKQPKGFGIYIRNIRDIIHGSPADIAAKAKRYKVKHVAILACWQEISHGKKSHRIFNFSKIQRYTQALKEVNVDVRLWGYPWHGMENQFVEAMHTVTVKTKGSIDGWILDPEKGYRGKKAFAETLMDKTLDAMDESLDLGVTSYGIPHYIKDFPWDTFCKYGWLSPQLYGTTKENTIAGLNEWRNYSQSSEQLIIPSVAAYGPKSGSALLEWMKMLRTCCPCMSGFIVWSWRQLSWQEWAVFADFLR